MTRGKSLTVILTLGVFLMGLLLLPDAQARKKRVIKDPDAPTNREAKVLGWGPVKTPNRGKNPEFMVRGVILEVNKTQDKKGDYFDVKILPIEILNNHQRVLTFDNFTNGVDITLFLPDSKKKELKKGRLVEFNQYYTEEVEQSIGGAKMVAMTLHKDIQGYAAGPGAYLRKPGFYPVQYKNALKGIKLYQSGIRSDKDAKAGLDYLATKHTDPELKTIAKGTYVEIYEQDPSGKCNLVKATQSYACN